jgi:hypothetical protein
MTGRESIEAVTRRLRRDSSFLLRADKSGRNDQLGLVIKCTLKYYNIIFINIYISLLKGDIFYYKIVRFYRVISFFLSMGSSRSVEKIDVL